MLWLTRTILGKTKKGKDIVGLLGDSRKRMHPTTPVLRASAFQRDHTHRYGSEWVVEEGKKWHRKQEESKYALKEFID